MAKTLGSVAGGTIVKLKESGTPQNYIVVHQGLPSDIYDASCDGTWLLRQDIIENQKWDSGNENKLESSDIQAWLNSTMLGKFDSNIQNAIKQVNIPYRQNGGSGGTDQTGANGLSCKIFLLSGYEVGWTTSNRPNLPVDGAKLSYFEAGIGSSADNKRIAKLNGSAANWWLRSPDTDEKDYAWLVFSNGANSSWICTSTHGVRPAMVMPTDVYVDDDGNVTTNQPPTAPGSITVPTVSKGSPCAITWTAATDPDGTIASYTLERSVNGSGWTQIFSGNALTYTDTIGADWGTVAYRVCAVDNLGMSGEYAASETQTVQDGILYISGPAEDMGSKTAPFAVSLTTGVSGKEEPVSTSLTVTLDGAQIYAGTVNTGTEVTIPIDTRAIGGGSHTLEAAVTAEGYISGTASYAFSTPELDLPNGGLGTQLQDEQGRPVFPQSLAALIGGLYGQSVAGNLQRLSRSVLFNRSRTPKYREVKVDLSTAKEGDIVKLAEDGKLVDFYVAKRNYEQSVNGAGRVLLVRKDCYDKRKWSTSIYADYLESTIDTWLNSTYLETLGEDVRSAIPDTKILCFTFPDRTNVEGTRKVFLLSSTEFGWKGWEEGSPLNIASTLKVAYLNGNKVAQWTRTPNDDGYPDNISSAGQLSNNFRADTNQGSRPCFTLMDTFSTTYYADESGNVYESQEYTEGGTFEDFWGNAVPMPRIEVVNYVGTGKNGQSNPCVINVNFQPKGFLVIANKTPTSGDMASFAIAVKPAEHGSGLFSHSGSGTGSTLGWVWDQDIPANIVWGESSVTYWAESTHKQFNRTNYPYSVIVFG